MKIAMADENGLKFLGDLKAHWESKGHEVRYEPGVSDKLAQWADVYFIDTWSNNIHALYDLYHGNPRKWEIGEWDNNKKPKIVCRPLDHEVWIGLARDQRIIDWVDISICIAPHIEQKLRSENTWNNLHLIKCGVDTDKFSLRKQAPGYNILIPCNEIDWVLKNVPEGIKIFSMLVDSYPDAPWNLYIKGKWCQGEYFKVYIEDLIKKSGAPNRIHVIDQFIENYDEFIEKMDYCLVPSYKEAYSYVTAECASKGILPILNHWYGAEGLWPREWLYTNPNKAVEMFIHNYDREEIRAWVVENSNVKDMLRKYDQLIGL